MADSYNQPGRNRMIQLLSLLIEAFQLLAAQGMSGTIKEFLEKDYAAQAGLCYAWV